MIMKRVATFAALSSLIADGASTATVTGRITNMASDHHQLMLANSDMCAVSAAVDISSVPVADRVKVNWDRKGEEDVIASLVKAPLMPAASG